MNSTGGSDWLVSEGETGRDCCATALAEATKAMMNARLFMIKDYTEYSAVSTQQSAKTRTSLPQRTRRSQRKIGVSRSFLLRSAFYQFYADVVGALDEGVLDFAALD